ncbi:MAG: TRAP transporter small permease [Clostridiaceae bacterium]|jgi:TRAP-type C4-dicarboxylate transport system permease small subunit|nr:TRAP transporter small permease [Clostridiaceae bacterium]
MKKGSVLYKIFYGIYRAQDKFNEIVLSISAVLLFVMTCAIMYQVIARYCFNSPVAGLEEWEVLMIIWSTALGMAVCLHKNDHAKLELVLRYCPRWVHEIVYSLNTAVVIIIGYVFISGGTKSFIIQMKQTPQGMMMFSRAWYYSLPMIVMGVMFVLFSMGKGCGYLATRDKLIMESTSELEMETELKHIAEIEGKGERYE